MRPTNFLIIMAGDGAYASVLVDFEALLRNTLDPEAVDRRAKQDQSRLVEKFGGRERVLQRGGFTGTPAPGEKADFISKE